ncbi:MAG: Nramp family divalent metal transporter [Phycisphaerae bacterium]|nr:Nramp family divalent metal transporter [Phycisphaerae bacterium]
MDKRVSLAKRAWLILLTVGPGIFCIGYTIGTGSVTSMATSGSKYGMQLLWVLALSCLFSWVLMEAYGRYAVVTGGTSIHSVKTKVRFGKPLSILMMVGVITGQWCCLSGLVGLSSHAIYEAVRLFIPALTPESYWAVLGIAVAILAVMYALLWIGRYSFFEQVLVVFVTLMGLAFIVSMFVVLPPPGEIAAGLIPRVPKVQGATLMIAAFVGTTMAAPTFVVRPLLMKGKGWTEGDLRHEQRDALISASFMFIISASIMVCATGALFHRGLTISKVLDMVHTLEPVAGKYAVGLFLVGTLSAGLSSIFPIAMVAPLLVADYRSGELQTRSSLFRVLAGVACLMGLIVPIFGSNPIYAQIATQVAQVFVLPLVIAVIAILVNRPTAMGRHRAGVLLNLGLLASFVFSCVMSYIALLEVIKLFRHGFA